MNILILIWSKQRLQAHEEWKCRTSMRVFCVVGEHWHLLGSHIQHKKVGISLPYWPELHVDIASPRRQDAYPLHPLSTADLLHPVIQQGKILLDHPSTDWPRPQGIAPRWRRDTGHHALACRPHSRIPLGGMEQWWLTIPWWSCQAPWSSQRDRSAASWCPTSSKQTG